MAPSCSRQAGHDGAIGWLEASAYPTFSRTNAMPPPASP
jgi:hypothetical protein